ncbi:threonine dehydratase [Amycolatopsis sp. WAC 01375]|uniref:threonine ammonia-lyase n=1 Tax=unclassified Amycolatopsis TaxID=2618356 RepID=UPI000F76A862|nr:MULTISPECIES: pyridoxal-phosphate dependent enzyme [unclassified Amycolatopsis]RSM82724.1 threonine dehydratase [Amycolatopsis sp. WAC 01375]RSN34760.1 threonine dehydratase [Amycolatopsis sp. WAC 01416]
MSSLVTPADLHSAAKRIRHSVHRTPLLGPFGDLWLKPEHLQRTGSFKVRGALNAVARLTTSHVLAQSSGNHGRAVAYAAARHGLRATVVLPATAPALKVDAVRALGAHVVIVPPALRERATAELAARTGATVVGSADFDVIAGHGTVGAEIVADLPEVRTVLVPVCNGGLLAGVAAAVKAVSPGTRVVGVEPALAGDAAESLRLRKLVRWPVERTYRTIADGLRAPVLGELAWRHIRVLVDDIVTVDEDTIVAAQEYLSGRFGVLAEPSGAVATAAHLTGQWQGTTVAIVSGGNVAAPAPVARGERVSVEHG